MEEGEYVDYHTGDGILKEGVVRGISHIELPVIGRGVIIQDCSGTFPNETYPYSSISIPEIFITRH